MPEASFATWSCWLYSTILAAVLVLALFLYASRCRESRSDEPLVGQRATQEVVQERRAAMIRRQAIRNAPMEQRAGASGVPNAQNCGQPVVQGHTSHAPRRKSRRDLAWALEYAKTQQLLMAERMGVIRVQREKEIEVEELEITRREKELLHCVHKPAEAERFRIETLAEAEYHRALLMAKAEAQAIRLKGEADAAVIRARGIAEAEVIRRKAIAEAEGLRAKLIAEAEGMKQKAAAWEKYTAPAIIQMLIDRLPEIASALARPLEGTEKIVIINARSNDSTGLDRLTESALDVLGQMPYVAELLATLIRTDMVELNCGAERGAGCTYPNTRSGGSEGH